MGGLGQRISCYPHSLVIISSKKAKLLCLVKVTGIYLYIVSFLIICVKDWLKIREGKLKLMRRKLERDASAFEISFYITKSSKIGKCLGSILINLSTSRTFYVSMWIARHMYKSNSSAMLLVSSLCSLITV